MPIMRNPFRSKPNDQVYDEHGRPIADRSGSSLGGVEIPRGKPLSVRTSSSGDSDARPTEYKMSEISDNGEYIPPSPPEKKSGMFWSTRSAASTRSTSTLNDNEPFNISRESFDSYRRSFDISARSPILTGTPPRPRQSLDARAMRLPSGGISASSSMRRAERPAMTSTGSVDKHPRRPSATPYQPKLDVLPDNHINPPSFQPEESEDVVSTQTSPSTTATTESASTNPTTPADSVGDRFEDVGLGEPSAAGQPEYAFKKQQPAPAIKKSGIFARFQSSADASTAARDETAKDRPNSSGLGIGLGMFGRKRAASGQGAELASIPQQQQQGYSKKAIVTTAAAPEAKPE